MARKATGQVIEKKAAKGKVFAIRFRAEGKRRYETLGSSTEGWNRARAEEELANRLADVRRGMWRAPTPTPDPAEEPTLHEFATDWFRARQLRGLRPRTLEHDRWSLTQHLLPYFHAHRLSEITPKALDGYLAAKVREDKLSNRSINATLQTLAAVLDVGIEYGHLTENPARSRRRRLPVEKPDRAFLEPPQVESLLKAAGELDSEDRSGRHHRRPLLATLAFAGLRIGELLALRWADVSLGSGRIKVRESKTAAGVREVEIQPELRDDLTRWKAETGFPASSDLVFPTGKGRVENRNNVRRRILMRAVERANEDAAEEARLPESLSPHALRRTYASWLIALGEDPAFVMGQLGHTDPAMTLGLYARALKSKRRRSTSTRSAYSTDAAPLAIELESA